MRILNLKKIFSIYNHPTNTNHHYKKLVCRMINRKSNGVTHIKLMRIIWTCSFSNFKLNSLWPDLNQFPYCT